MKISLVGPCSPQDLAHLFYEEDSFRAKFFSGYRGIPVSSLAEGLLNAGHEVSVITSAPSANDYSALFRGERIELHVVKARIRARDLALTHFASERKLLLEKLNLINPDVVHAHWTYEFALAALASHKPVLVTAHDAPLTVFKLMLDPYRFFRLLMAYRVRFKIQNLTVVSPYLLKKWQKEMFWRSSALVIPNISPFLFEDTKNYPDLGTRVLVIGESGKLKNIKNLLKAWPFVIAQIPEAKLDLVGRGLGGGEEMQKWLADENLNRTISWHGLLERESVSELLTRADVLVQPSLEESFGLVLLEAMSHGVAVIGGKNSGAVPYVVADAGLLVNVRKPKEIASAIVQMLQDRELRENFGARGQKRVATDFSAEKISQQYIDEYLRIIGLINA